MFVKQAIVIRKDLKMRRGKEIAQGAHASIAWLTRRLQVPASGSVLDTLREAHLSHTELEWIDGLFTKVCLQVGSEAELMDIYERAVFAGVEASLITDAGLTEFGGVPTRTCIAIGPDLAERIDGITSHLKLY